MKNVRFEAYAGEPQFIVEVEFKTAQKDKEEIDDFLGWRWDDIIWEAQNTGLNEWLELDGVEFRVVDFIEDSVGDAGFNGWECVK